MRCRETPLAILFLGLDAVDVFGNQCAAAGRPDRRSRRVQRDGGGGCEGSGIFHGHAPMKVDTECAKYERGRGHPNQSIWKGHLRRTLAGITYHAMAASIAVWIPNQTSDVWKFLLPHATNAYHQTFYKSERPPGGGLWVRCQADPVCGSCR